MIVAEVLRPIQRAVAFIRRIKSLSLVVPKTEERSFSPEIIVKLPIRGEPIIVKKVTVHGVSGTEIFVDLTDPDSPPPSKNEIESLMHEIHNAKKRPKVHGNRRR